MTEKKAPLKSTISKAAYDKDNCVRVTMKLNRATDAPVLTMLASVPSMSGYIRSLILADIEKNHPDMLKVEWFDKGENQAMRHALPKLKDTLIRHNKFAPKEKA